MCVTIQSKKMSIKVANHVHDSFQSCKSNNITLECYVCSYICKANHAVSVHAEKMYKTESLTESISYVKYSSESR